MVHSTSPSSPAAPKRKSSQPLSLTSLGESLRDTFLSSTASLRQLQPQERIKANGSAKSPPSNKPNDTDGSIVDASTTYTPSSMVQSILEKRGMTTNPFLRNRSPSKQGKRCTFEEDVFDDDTYDGSDYRRHLERILDPKPPGPMNTDDWREYGKEMVDYIAEYLDSIHKRRVTPSIEPGYLKKLLPDSAPFKPERWEDIMKDFEIHIMPGVTHWQHPRFHAYFPAGNSYPSILADMLTDAIGCIGFSWVSII